MNRQFKTRRTLLGGLALSGIPWILSGCTEESSGPEPDSSGNSIPTLKQRAFGIAASEPASGDFRIDVIDRILETGSRRTSLSVYWDLIEPSPGVYAPDPNYLHIGEAFYSPLDMNITLGFSVLDTTNKRLPAWLDGRTLDDSEVISAFNAMLDWAATQMPTLHLPAIVIGNEVDVYLNAHPQEWPAWQRFFAATSSHARTLWPEASIGCKATFAGLISPQSREHLQETNKEADAIMATYYSIGADFSVLEPTSVHDVFAQLGGLAGTQPVQILEIGAPSDPSIGGSEQRQADFVSELFVAWDQWKDRITEVEYFALHDFSPTVVQQLVSYYGFDNQRFAAYLGSLGLRTNAGAGVDKAGWPRLKEELSRRL